MQFSNSELKNYLLGKFDEQAEEEIGVQIIADGGFEEKLSIAENELMEDFLDKNLSPEDERLFIENFLVCEERQKQLSEINFFREYSKNNLPEQKVSEKNQDQTPNFWEGIKKRIGFDLRFAVPVFAVLIIAVLGFYFFYSPNQLSSLEQEYAGLNSGDFSNADSYSKFSSVNLISGTYRDSGNEKKVLTKTLSDKIVFRLALPFNLPENEIVQAEVIKDQKTIFRQPELRFYQNQNGQEVRLILPKAIFSNGKYQIKIENPKKIDSSVIYNFAVE